MLRRVVVVVLAVLAFSTATVGTAAAAKPPAALCKSERLVLKTAEEAYFAKNGRYATMPELVGDWIRRPSRYYKVTLDGDGFTVTAKPNKGC